MNNISNGYEDISVEIVDYNQSIAKHIWDCGKMTWKRLQNTAYNSADKDIKTYIDDVIERKALPMPREQALITFRINNISRVCLAQLTRQRESAFNVESQMPCPVEHNVILPLNFCKDAKFNRRARNLIKQSQQLYDDLIAADYPPQDCRYLLMHGQTTSCVYVVSVDKFVSSFSMRCENNLSDEINLVYRLCKKAFLDRLENDFQQGYIDNLTAYFYTKIVKSADCMGAKNKVGCCVDRVFGNSFRRYPAVNSNVAGITYTCDYDYRKSAWYLELQRLNKDLLFVDEDKMIANWQSDRGVEQ